MSNKRVPRATPFTRRQILDIWHTAPNGIYSGDDSVQWILDGAPAPTK